MFLDFDGVLHPFSDRRTDAAFCYLPRFEAVLRDFPQTTVVITSTQREDQPITELRALFSPDVAAKIAGSTPIEAIRNANDLAGSRHREILAYLTDNPASSWVALDDDAILFPADCPDLILCDDGFRTQEEIRLRAALMGDYKNNTG